MTSPALFLIPVPLGDTEHRLVLPEYNREIVGKLRYFIVENVRTARRFIRKADPGISIDELTFFELNKHTSPESLASFIEPIGRGESVGVISEAGCPAVADPGADIVAMAQRSGYRVVPLVGPTSIILALMASGFSGQRFAFHGYLPVDATARAQRIKTLEARAQTDDETQIFIETPYRNNKLAAEIVRICKPATKLCIASEITCEGEDIRSLTVKEWRAQMPDLDRKPTLFLIYK
jgi:16S rRNA (cytidine1402-2'-O)-methyltransferase